MQNDMTVYFYLMQKAITKWNVNYLSHKINALNRYTLNNRNKIREYWSNNPCIFFAGYIVSQDPIKPKRLLFQYVSFESLHFIQLNYLPYCNVNEKNLSHLNYKMKLNNIV